MTRIPILALAVAIGAGCGTAPDGPPALHVDRSECAHCRMLISEPVYAAAYRAPGEAPRVFDDIGCLVAAARGEEEPASLVFWFRDAEADAWMEARQAVFVRSAALPTPMSGGIVAYRDEPAARAAAARHRGEIVRSVDALLAAASTEGEEAGL